MKKFIFLIFFTFTNLIFASSIADLVIPRNDATIPAPKLKSDGDTNSWWMEIHKMQLEQKNKMKNAQIIFVGASVIMNWTKGMIGREEKRYQRGIKSWEKYYVPRKSLNFGISGDNTANVLWRMQNGALEGLSPKVAIVAVGFNNKTTYQKTAEGMLAVLRKIRIKCPETKILFMPYLPTTNKNWRNGKSFQAYDLACEKIKADEMIIPLEISDAFLNKEGILKDIKLIPDNLHPGEQGYQIWAEAMEPVLTKLLEEKKGDVVELYTDKPAENKGRKGQ